MRHKDILKYILDYYETKSNYENGKIFLEVISQISDKLGLDFDFDYSFTHVDIPDDEKDIVKGYSVIQNLVFDENCQEYILALLRNNHYYMKTFIKDLIKQLGNAKTENEADSIINKYLSLPIINNVKFNGTDEYTIQSCYGDYSFLLANKVIQDSDILAYLESGDLKKQCHANATALLDYYDLYTICSLVPNYFEDYYYHSYSFKKDDNYVIDFCSNMFMKKPIFDDLYAPKQVLFMKNEEVRSLYKARVKNIKSSFNAPYLLKCALYIQSLNLKSDKEEMQKILAYQNDLNLQQEKTML